VLNLRIRMPIVGYDHPRNFITKIASYARVVDIPNSMTVLPELLPLAVDMATRKLTGTVNLTNPGAISHNEILTLYRKHVDPSFEWTNFTEQEQDEILMSKRSNNLLDTSRLQTEYPSVSNIHESVATLFANWRCVAVDAQEKNVEVCEEYAT
jgi:3,5-epimerase/4-reductase